MGLAAFGWTPLDDDSMLIVGGTDGELLQENSWTIDFKYRVATMSSSVDSQVAMNKVFKRGDHVYSFGGFGSSGMHFHR